MKDLHRYSPQMMFDGLGKSGQEKLLESRVVIVGVGGLGTVAANNLCRAGVGFLRIVDRDCVELSNLQRQLLYDEEDASRHIPKATAACSHLSRINSGVALESVAAEVNASNIESLIADTDLVLDCTDNIETRYLINEACDKLGKPWIYTGVLRGSGLTMNILPGGSPCFRCLFPEVLPPGSYPTCKTEGVLNSIISVIASVETTEAMKILIGSPAVRKGLFYIDVWNNQAEYVEVRGNPDCPVCGRHQYEYVPTPGGGPAFGSDQ